MMKIRIVSVILSLTLVCALLVMAQAPPAPPQQPVAQQPVAQQPPAAPPPQPAAQVSAADLSLQNAALGEVVDRLARQLHMVLVLPPAPGLQGSVSINSYGETKSLDARNLLEMILRINGYALVQEGDVYRVVKMLDAMHQPIPIQISGKEVPEDDQIMLDLVFLKYITVDELEKVLREFIGENARVLTYAPANLLFILDNRRNIHRIEGLIRQFDSDMFTNQRVRLFELENARPSDVQKDLDNVLKAISLDNKTSTVHFLAVDRINILIAVAPNPGVFDTVEEWIKKFDVPATVASGAVDTYVYTVRYGRNDCLAQALNQLFNPGAGFLPAGLGGYGASAPAGAYGNYGYGAGGSGAYTGAYGGGGGYGIGGMGSYGGGGGSTYGNTNSFSPAFGGSGGCGGAGGMGGATGGAMGGAYGSPAFGGYTAQTPLMGNAAGAAGQAAGAAAAAAAAAAGLPAPPPPPRIVPLSFDNKLMIQADPQRYQSILKMLEQLDKAPRQILLDAKIYSIDLTDQFASGVAAYFQNSGVGLPSGISGLAPYAALTGGTVTLSAGMMVSASRQLLGALSLNENISHVHILSEPSLIATDSIPATINVGTQVPVLTSQVGTPLQLGGTNAFTQNISGVSTGITLNVNARVNPSGVVTLIVDQENSSPSSGSGSSSGSSSQNLTPSFSQQVVQTQITMQDGDTIAVGGLIGETTTSSVNGIPLLSRIPYIGALFGSKSYSHERTELILFMTPHVIYDTTDLLEASDELVLKVKKLQKYIKDRN
jgi:general secretion pathway protein D